MHCTSPASYTCSNGIPGCMRIVLDDARKLGLVQGTSGGVVCRPPTRQEHLSLLTPPGARADGVSMARLVICMFQAWSGVMLG